MNIRNLKKIYILLICILVSLFSHSKEDKLEELKEKLEKIEVNIFLKNYRGTKRFLKFQNKETIFYRELNYYEKFNPNFIEIELSEKEKMEMSSSKNKGIDYKKILEKKQIKDNVEKMEIMDYYIKNNEYYEKEKIVTKSGKFIAYKFDTFYQKREIEIDKKKFDENFNKVLNSKNIQFTNRPFYQIKITSFNGVEKEILVITDNNTLSYNGLMYCDFKFNKYSICERIDLNSNKIKITKYYDYVEVKINENEGFYIIKSAEVPKIKTEDGDYVPYEELKSNMSEFYYFLEILSN